MMRPWFALGLLLACAHGQSGASKSGGASNVADYYPLAVGNTWSYEGRLLGGPMKFDVKIESEDQGRFTDNQKNVLRVDNFGVRDDKRYILRGPLEVGTKWNSLVSISSYEQYMIIEAGQDCAAPAGSFHDCVVVESRNKDEGDRLLIATLTFAPKVGLVRIETLVDDKGRQIPQSKIELTSYQVAPAPAPAPR